MSENNRFLGSISASSLRNLLPRSVSSKKKMNSNRTKSRLNSENTPPLDPNIQVDNYPASPSILKESSLKAENSQIEAAKPDNNSEISAPSDPHVKVVVRIRPSDHPDREGYRTVTKVSDDSIYVGDRKLTFDSVFDSNSNQEDIFQSVGVPLVKSALTGYNTSMLAYGQTGCGKTHTMWGPPGAMVEGHSASSNQGIVPRIFQMLFSEIQREKEQSEGKQINYQCRCSFLEIYNDQIGDLLDPTQRNLEIKDDAKNGLYVENLSEEYVTSYEEVAQILIKGLSSRKVGATSLNSKSSRSHIVFTCIIESWCKGNSSNCFGSSKTSRISLIDLAGLDKKRLDDPGTLCKKEDKYVKKSTAQLGYLVNVLAEKTRTGKSEAVPYKISWLTHLLRESLGGNAKLTILCTISPDKKWHGETMSTLRFGQRAKFVQNDPVINEITEDDVNDLSDQIRQLKEELIRAKSNECHSVGSNHRHSSGRSVRESLNQLRVSINRSLILPRLDSDVEEEVHIDEDDVRELRLQLDNLNSFCEENDTCDSKGFIRFSSIEGCEADLTSEHYISCAEDENEDTDSEAYHTKFLVKNSGASVRDSENSSDMSNSTDHTLNSISIRAIRESAVLLDPTLSESPKIGITHRKSMISSSTLLQEQDNALESAKLNSDALQQSQKTIDHIRSSLQSSKHHPGPSDSLAASLQRGLQIIDYHQRNSATNKSGVSFSFGNSMLKPCTTIDKANASVQTLPEERQCSDAPSPFFICVSCQQKGLGASIEVQHSLKRWIVAVDQPKSSNQVPMDTEKMLAEAIERERELENICKKQAATIEQLNHQVEQYKHEKSQNANLEYHNAVQVDDMKHEILPNNDENNKLLGWNDNDKHQSDEFIKEKCEVKEILEDLDQGYGNISSDLANREAFHEEIGSSRSKLQQSRSIGKLRSSCLLSRSIQLRQSLANSQGSGDEELEKERQRWMEMESEWISLTEDLRIDLDSHRRRAEKVEMELTLEKKCTEELDDALTRAVLGHGRMVEHYAELQEKYNDLVEKHRLIMEGVAEVKRAAAKAGAKGHGSRFAKSLAAELSSSRIERDRERELLKRENKSLKIQLRDTAEAVHAAGELLVRLREAENAASLSEENFTKAQEENDRLKKQVEKLKRKHKMEMITMKQYLAESRLPEAALRPPLFREEEDSDLSNHLTTPVHDDDQAWRAEFGAIYQDHY